MKKELKTGNTYDPIKDQIIDVIKYHSPKMAYEILNGFNADIIGYDALGSLTCPILVNGIHSGATLYFQQLHSIDGVPVKYKRIKSSNSPVCPHPCDLYHVETIDNLKSEYLWVYPYCRRRTNLAPEGFMVLPYSDD